MNFIKDSSNFRRIAILLILSTINCLYRRTSACMPPSYPNRDHVPEVKYELKPERTYVKRISRFGDSLRIGSAVEKLRNRFASASDLDLTYSCELVGGEGAGDYETAIYNITRINSRDGLTEHKYDPVKYWAHFVLTKKEIWECKDDNNAENPKLIRVVTELIAHKDIMSIHYYDGVEVSVITYGDVASTKIREIKYFKKHNDGDEPLLVIYRGHLKFKSTEKYKAPNLIPGTPQISLDGDDYYKEVCYSSTKDQNPKTVEISDTGIKLRLGSNSQMFIGSKSSKARCRKVPRLNPYSSTFRTVIEQKVGWKDFPMYANITQRQYSNYYFPFNEQIWSCILEDKGDEEFFRIVNEGCIRAKLSTIEYLESIQILNEIEFDKQEKCFMFKEVKYVSHVKRNLLRYEGTLKLIRRQRLDLTNRELDYVLDGKHNTFKHSISPEGLDLRIGSRIRNAVGDLNTKVFCYKLTSFKYDSLGLLGVHTEFKIISNIDGIAHASINIPKGKEREYFNILKRDVHACEKNKPPETSEKKRKKADGVNVDEAQKEKKALFWRVRTEYEFVRPVHEIESFDGVSIFYGPPNKEGFVKIIEIKYVDLMSMGYHPVKYVGKFNMDEIRDGDASHDSDMSIRKTEDEIYWIVGHFADITPNSEDVIHQAKLTDDFNTFTFVKGGSQYLTFGHKGGTFEQPSKQLDANKENPFELQIHWIRFGTKRLRLVGSDSIKCDILTREQLDESERQIEKQVIESDIPPAVSRITRGKVKDEAFKEKKPDSVEREFWRCTSPEEGIKFLRVVITQTILKRVGLDKDSDFDHVEEARCLNPSNAWIEMKNETHYAIKLRKIRYIDLSDSEQKKFEGHMILRDANRDIIERGKWKSGTENIQSLEEIITRTYQESRRKVIASRLYTTKLQEKSGLSIIIDSKWKRVFGHENTIMDCTADDSVSEEKFNKFFRTRIIDEEESGSDLMRYFQHLKSKVYNCVDKENNEKKFLRILTQYRMNDPYKKIQEIRYTDGVTIFVGTSTEIIEVKYIDPQDYTSLKFEGQVELPTEMDEAKPIEKTNVGMRETHYFLQVDERHRKFVEKTGYILEVGTERFLDVIPQTKFTDAYSCNFRDSSAEEGRLYEPDVQFSVRDENGVMKPVENSSITLMECFNYEKIEMLCERGNDDKFIRLDFKMEKKPGCEIARIYHYDGVSVNKKDDSLTIRQIIYEWAEKRAYYNLFKFVGFLRLPDSPQLPGGKIVHIYPRQTREIVYLEDIKTVQKAAINDKLDPIKIEVGSPLIQTSTTSDDSAFCQINKDKSFNKEFETKFATEWETDVASMPKKSEVRDNSIFDFTKQDIFTCTSRKGQTFLRIVNVLLTTKNVYEVFYFDGTFISIARQVTPNMRIVQVIEEKFVNSTTHQIFRFNGDLTIENEVTAKQTKLFAVPFNCPEYPIEWELVPTGDSRRQYWPMEFLIVMARQYSPLESDLHTTSLTFDPLREKKIKLVGETGFRFAIGSPAEKRVKFDYSEGTQLRCFMDNINRSWLRRFTTKIVMFIDNHQYVLDEDWNEVFRVAQLRVWVCVHEEVTILRVETTLDIIVPVSAVTFAGEMVEILRADEKLVVVRETKYVDPKDFKTLQYNGKVLIRKKEQGDEPTTKGPEPKTKGPEPKTKGPEPTTKGPARGILKKAADKVKGCFGH